MKTILSLADRNAMIEDNLHSIDFSNAIVSCLESKTRIQQLVAEALMTGILFKKKTNRKFNVNAYLLVIDLNDMEENGLHRPVIYGIGKYNH